MPSSKRVYRLGGRETVGAPFLASFARKPALSLSKGGDFVNTGIAPA